FFTLSLATMQNPLANSYSAFQRRGSASWLSTRRRDQVLLQALQVAEALHVHRVVTLFLEILRWQVPCSLPDKIQPFVERYLLQRHKGPFAAEAEKAATADHQAQLVGATVHHHPLHLAEPLAFIVQQQLPRQIPGCYVLNRRCVGAAGLLRRC